MKVLIWTLLFIATILAGCNNPTVDASTDKSMQASIASVRASLPEDKRTEFDRSVQLLVFKDLDIRSLLAKGTDGAKEVKGKMRDAVHGKTANQIIAEANQLKADRETTQKAQTPQEQTPQEKK